MLEIKPLTSSFSVSPQISLDDLSVIAELGYKSVINNRPDDEISGQIGNAIIQKKCVELGLEYQYQPVVSGTITARDCQSFSQNLSRMPLPILAFCRSGTRSSLLWLGCSDDNKVLEYRVKLANSQGYQFDINQLISLMNG